MTDEERNGPEETFHDTERKLRDRIEALELALTQSQDIIDRWINTSSEQYQTIVETQEALTQSRAETAAAYERAAREVDCGGCGGSCDDPVNCAAENAAEIRALATPDQTAALDVVRAEAMREAAEIANSMLLRSTFGTDTETVVTYRDFIGSAILAAIKGAKA